ncbi:CsgG/HfaB family protein [Fusobacterium sp.]|uniref:CsgG/HfaB family protein n=1 Tax=Fusobacterium sp. TaxID=68766 RepID=UPI000C700BDF|nr:CsgG/HfaB family protein [Fusobacterium sp.]
MKKLVFFILLCICLIGCNRLESKVERNNKLNKIKNYDISKENISPRRRIAIGNIKNYSRFGTQRTDTIVKNILVAELSKTGRFNILKRSELNSILEELAFSKTYSLNDIVAKQKFLNADYIITGDVIKYEINTLGSKTLFSNSKEQQAQATIELEVIDILNGKVWSKIGKGVASYAYDVNLDLGNYVSYGRLEQEAFTAAVFDGVEKIIKEMDKYPWSAIIIKKNGKNIIINSGLDDNLNLGTNLNVYKQGEPVMYRGELLGYEETIVGTAVVKSYLGENAAVLEYKGVDFSLPAVVKLK